MSGSAPASIAATITAASGERGSGSIGNAQ
jgi:hypothetical protein